MYGFLFDAGAMDKIKTVTEWEKVFSMSKVNKT